MKKYALNDIAYNFKPLEIFQPDPDYKVDEKELQESIKKSRELIARIRSKNYTTKSDIPMSRETEMR